MVFVVHFLGLVVSSDSLKCTSKFNIKLQIFVAKYLCVIVMFRSYKNVMTLITLDPHVSLIFLSSPRGPLHPDSEPFLFMYVVKFL